VTVVGKLGQMTLGQSKPAGTRYGLRPEIHVARTTAPPVSSRTEAEPESGRTRSDPAPGRTTTEQAGA